MEVSVIIPTNASRESIFQSINSVKEQDYKYKIEILVVVNGSKANGHIIKKLKEDKDVILLHCKTPNGNAARHQGVLVSSFQILSFLDDDDLWVPNKLSCQISLMDKEKTNFSYTGRFVKSPIRSYYTITKPQSKNLSKEIFEKNFIGGFSSFTILKDHYFKVGGLDQELGCFQDYEFYLRCLNEINNISIIDKPLVIYSQHFGVKISNNFTVNKISTNVIINKYKDHIYIDSLKKSLKRMLFRKGLKYVNFKMVLFSKTL